MKVIIDYDYDSYNDAQKDVYKAINIVAGYYNLELIQLKWTHFFNFCQDVLEVNFIKFPIGDELSRILSGCIISIDNVVTIAYNSKMIPNRRFFTICHEIVHRLCDIEDVQRARGFTDYLELTSIDPKDDFVEFRANVGAGLLMCNDESLSIQLYSGKSFSELCNYFYMSKAAMYFRLTEYVVYKVSISPYIASQVVSNYIKGDRQFFDKMVAPYVIKTSEKIFDTSTVPKRLLSIY